MKRGSQSLIIFTAVAAVFIVLALVIGNRWFTYLVNGKCVSDTLRDIDIMTDQFKSSSTEWHAIAIRMNDCIDGVVFANGQQWKTVTELKGMKEVKCSDDADAHILIFKRDIGFLEAIKSKEKILAAVIARDVTCRDVYGYTFFTNMPGGVLAGSGVKDESLIYCLVFRIDQKNKGIEITKWETVSAKEKCKI